jgi:isopenicillin-N epimerase
MYGLRRQFRLNPEITFLNHGSFGATPRPVFRAYQHWQRELENQPVEFLGRRFLNLMQAARQSLAELLVTDANNLVYTRNVTEAMNIVAHSLCLNKGDEVLSTNHEYGAIDRMWRFLSKERGFRYTNQPIPVTLTSAQAFLEAFWQGVSSQTRIISLSHITSPTSILFPVKQVAERARQAGILTVVDGAHGPGQIPLKLDDLGVDFYGGNLHKWLCAPKGAGFLFARADVQHLLKPLIVSWGFEAEAPGPSRFIDHHEWTGTCDIAAYLSVPDAIKFQKDHNWEEVRRVCSEMASETLTAISAMSGLDSFEQPDQEHPDGFLQMVSAPLQATSDLPKLKSLLYDKYKIEVPLIHWNGSKLIRVSVQGYNTRKDLGKLISALKENKNL